MKRLRGLLLQAPQVAEWEQGLNTLACKLYDLTEGELAIIGASL